jgi:hypothetical protein
MSWPGLTRFPLVLVLVAAAGCAAPARDDEKLAHADPVLEVADTSALTREAVRDMVMRLADGYYNRIRPTIDRMEAAAKTPEERHLIHQMKYSAAAAAFDIAVSPRAGQALLDLLVLISLQRAVLERYWMPEVLGDQASELLSVVERTERESWRTAERAMTAEERAELRRLIDEWLADNPEAIRVAHVRFSDFIHLSNRESADRAGGILAEVEEAAEAIEDIESSATAHCG